MRTVIIFISMLIGSAAFASGFSCDLDDCHISERMHRIDAVVEAGQPYNWLVHELAAARDSASRGDRGGSAQTAMYAHRALSTQSLIIAEMRSPEFVMAMHRSLSSVMTDAGRPAPQRPQLPGDAFDVAVSGEVASAR